MPRLVMSFLFPEFSRKMLQRRLDMFVQSVEDKVNRTDGLSEIVVLQRDVLQSFFPMVFVHLLPRLAVGMGSLGVLGHLSSSIVDGKDLTLTVTRGLPHNVTSEMVSKHAFCPHFSLAQAMSIHFRTWIFGPYEGRIRVVHDPTKTKLNQGEVLCCHGTDPSWTPLFLSAGALVMDVGGIMTHGSVVAREYGIPAVVGLEKVTERLKTGQLVRVDGSSGTVHIVE